MLYIYPISEDHLITHDGVSQLGSIHMGIDKFCSMLRVPYMVTYWRPDVYTNRYPRSNYQRHLSASGKCSLEDNTVNTSEWDRRGQL